MLAPVAIILVLTVSVPHAAHHEEHHDRTREQDGERKQRRQGYAQCNKHAGDESKDGEVPNDRPVVHHASHHQLQEPLCAQDVAARYGRLLIAVGT